MICREFIGKFCSRNYSGTDSNLIVERNKRSSFMARNPGRDDSPNRLYKSSGKRIICRIVLFGLVSEDIDSDYCPIAIINLELCHFSLRSTFCGFLIEQILSHPMPFTPQSFIGLTLTEWTTSTIGIFPIKAIVHFSNEFVVINS